MIKSIDESTEKDNSRTIILVDIQLLLCNWALTEPNTSETMKVIRWQILFTF